MNATIRSDNASSAVADNSAAVSTANTDAAITAATFTRFTRRQHVIAWAVHAFTLTGLVWATLAVVALLESRPHWMWLWLGIALVVDGVDGNMARKHHIKEVVPWFNGAVVDNIVDYLTWTAIPAAFMVMYLPLGPRPLAISLIILVLVSSMFCYANEAAKSGDYYFVGFPAAWNIVAVLLWVWNAPMAVCIAAIFIFSAMTLVPLHYTHPFRVERGRIANIAATFIWIISTGTLIAGETTAASLSSTAVHGLVAVNVAAGAWLIIGGVRRSLSGR
ncbi:MULTISPECIES: CDP-alcohol phosphatidyltransferase family protein [Corynebacterium]|uniref:Phosphatidylcholine synthase n=1 Tax=Corynebacterium amycolatum TaxID=43765 RepID=A0AB38XWW2_CORAY|nr:MULTISPECIES: CDP-alcohol phosphatidyltransferase family protein [Corynebacterium]AIN82448.1 CDP-alcohol phosphatidyltransferase family protein [Corynebacterium sp. ATCC 6931]MBC6725782.1 phosphatidylcholine synthase [Corynebacterium amycolatum]QRP17208.1 CDP-alcohol phosphatidyltransferase family protein [Corynebacterium amycolatum]WET44138.1 phosphatidylcholine synthase [Corynebacterium amycolatum]